MLGRSKLLIQNFESLKRAFESHPDKKKESIFTASTSDDESQQHQRIEEQVGVLEGIDERDAADERETDDLDDDADEESLPDATAKFG